MLRSQRLSRILEMIRSEGAVTVDSLVESLGISPATARRDLDVLDSEGHVRRTRGGAESLGDHHLTQFHDSSLDEFGKHKIAIAKLCTMFLQPGYVIGMTGGSTVSEVANAIVEWTRQHSTFSSPNSTPLLTIVTNAIDVAYRLANQANIKIVVVGGQLNQTSYESTGPFGIHMLEQLWFDLAFIGVNGFDENGPGTVDEYEAATNRMMVHRSNKPIVVADSGKFGKRSFSSIGGPSAVRTVVTDSDIADETLEKLKLDGYQIHVARLDQHE